jgi:hypothetical protein
MEMNSRRCERILWALRRVSTSKDSTTDGCDSYPLHIPYIPWHTVALNYLTHLPMSNGFDNVVIVVDRLARMARFLPCKESVTTQETANSFYKELIDYTDYLVCWSVTATQNSSLAFGGHFGDASVRVWTCLQSTPGDGWANGARQQHVSTTSTCFLLLRWIQMDRLVASSGICVQRFSWARNWAHPLRGLFWVLSWGAPWSAIVQHATFNPGFARRVRAGKNVT